MGGALATSATSWCTGDHGTKSPLSPPIHWCKFSHKSHSNGANLMSLVRIWSMSIVWRIHNQWCIHCPPLFFLPVALILVLGVSFHIQWCSLCLISAIFIKHHENEKPKCHFIRSTLHATLQNIGVVKVECSRLVHKEQRIEHSRTDRERRTKA